MINREFEPGPFQRPFPFSARARLEKDLEAYQKSLLKQQALRHVYCMLYGLRSQFSLGEEIDFHNQMQDSLAHLIDQAQKIGPEEFIREAQRKFHQEKTEDSNALANFAWSMIALGRAI